MLKKFGWSIAGVSVPICAVAYFPHMGYWLMSLAFVISNTLGYIQGRIEE